MTMTSPHSPLYGSMGFRGVPFAVSADEREALRLAALHYAEEGHGLSAERVRALLAGLFARLPQEGTE